MRLSLRATTRAAAVLLSAAVLAPVLPGTAPASAAPRSALSAVPASASSPAAKAEWTARDARAKAIMAHVARRTYARALAAYRANPTAENRAAADWARRDSAAKATISHLAGKRAERAARAVRGSRSAAPAASSHRAVWDRLAQCESGGNWSINTGNGYYGGLQFSASTWRSVGGKGLPHQNSKAEQIKRAEILLDRAGWRSWPACTRKLGLR